MQLTGKSLLLLLLFSPVNEGEPNIPISGRTRLMKMVFLFQKEVLDDFVADCALDVAKMPEFFAWHYGPFSTQLLDELEFLVNRGYIEREAGAAPSAAELEEYAFWLEDGDTTSIGEYLEESYTLSADKGIPRAKSTWDELSANQQHMLKEFKASLTRASLDRILEYVYKKYAASGYVDKSLIRERYLT